MSLRGLASETPDPAAALSARGWACKPSLSEESGPADERGVTKLKVVHMHREDMVIRIQMLSK